MEHYFLLFPSSCFSLCSTTFPSASLFFLPEKFSSIFLGSEFFQLLLKSLYSVFISVRYFHWTQNAGFIGFSFSTLKTSLDFPQAFSDEKLAIIFFLLCKFSAAAAFKIFLFYPWSPGV